MRDVHRVAIGATLSIAVALAPTIAAEAAIPTLRLQVSLVGQPSVEAHSLPARVVARPVGLIRPHSGSSRQEIAPVERDVAVPGLVSLSLPSGVLWSLNVAAAGHWHEPQLVAVSNAGAAVTAALVPLAKLRGRMAFDERGVHEALRCSFRRVALGDGGALDLEIAGWRELAVTVEEGTFRCEVPAGTHHLKVQVPGFVPHYFWDVEATPAAPVELGELRFRKGLSLAGEVRIEGAAADEAPRLTLQPARTDTPSPSIEARLNATAATTRANARGFFQLQGLAPGSYRLLAEAEGLAPVRRENLELLAEGEYVLDEPLVLRPPSELELEIRPALHPYGAPWTVELLTASGPQVLETVGRVEVETSGLARFENFPPGRYEVVVVGPAGSRYAFEPVEVVEDRQVERIELPLVEVAGELRLGDEPLAATLLFGGRDSRERVTLEADEAGAFAGHLPHPGTWAVDVRHLDGWVQRTSPVEVPAGRDRVELVIELPDSELGGRVVDEEGRPVAGAGVVIVDTSERRPALRGRSGAEGGFRIRGVMPGSYLAYAENGQGASAWLPLALAEGERRVDERLVIRRQRTFHGRVRSSLGPVPGARVDVLPDAFGAGPTWVAQDVTGPDGSFAVDLPASASSARAVVFPPGHAWSVRRVDLAAQEVLELAVAPEGGTLLLTLPDRENVAFFHSGIELPLGFLREWAQLRDSPDGADGVLVAPDVEPGDIRFCSFAEPPRRGPADAFAECPAGYLPVGGLLALGPRPKAEEESP